MFPAEIRKILKLFGSKSLLSVDVLDIHCLLKNVCPNVSVNIQYTLLALCTNMIFNYQESHQISLDSELLTYKLL